MVRSTALLTGLTALASSALGAITITQPSSGAYFVQFSTNTISWTYTQGDPAQVSLEIINGNSSFLNGVFSIAEYVDTSIQSFTITNVTLVTGSDYQVQMVDPTNNTVVYATSQTFSVLPNGTAPATTSAPVSSAAASTGSRSGASGSASASASGASASASASHSAAGTVSVNGLVGAFGALLAAAGAAFL